MKKTIASLMGVFAVSVVLGSATFAQKIDQTYSYVGLGGSGYGDMVIGVKAINNNGKVAVCGIFGSNLSRMGAIAHPLWVI